MIAKYVGAYMVLECYHKHPIPIISVNVTSVANSPAVASVHVHPNPFLHDLTRGINVFIICTIKKKNVHTHPVNLVMFVGDITSIQISANSTRTEYVINLVDNRRYISELPTYYLKLIRTEQEVEDGALTRDGGNVVSIYDETMDANFYGIPGDVWSEDQAYYDIKMDSAVATSFMNTWYAKGIKSYWAKLTECLLPDKGWEPYYINMNKKKRIISHHCIYDNGIFNADLLGANAEAATAATLKNSQIKAENTVFYEEAMQRFSDLGYIYNTNVFPSLVGGQAEELNIKNEQNVEYEIKSTLFHGNLIAYTMRRTSELTAEELASGMYPDKEIIQDPAPTDNDKFAMSIISDESLGISDPNSKRGIGTEVDYVGAEQQKVYSQTIGDNTYYAIINNVGKNEKPRLAEFNLIPKLYGTVPPICNWATLKSGMTFSAIINEPPITALKYNYKETNSGGTILSSAYPLDIEVSTNLPEGQSRETTYFTPSEAPVPGTIMNKIGTDQKLYLTKDQEITQTSEDHANRSDTDKTVGAVDIVMPFRSAITSYTSGYINEVRNSSSGGIYVTVVTDVPRDHTTDGRKHAAYWKYMHLDKQAAGIIKGAAINAGDIIGYAGVTGNVSDIKGAKEYKKDPAHKPPPKNGILHLQVYYTNGSGKEYHVNISSLFSSSNSGPYYVSGLTSASLMDIAPDMFTPNNAVIKRDTFEKAEKGDTPAYGESRKYIKGSKIKPTQDENIYGIKRVSKNTSAIYEMTKMDNGDTLTLEQKFGMLKQKVKNDYMESTVSRNTGTISINGLNENVMVGLPFILYHPGHEIFYYGFVAEVSHRIDNSEGTAYTEISLNGIKPILSVEQVEDKFSDYLDKNFMVYANDKNISNLNDLYYLITQTTVSKDRIDILDMRDKKYGPQLAHLQELGQRPICTLERLMNYMYGNKDAPGKLGDTKVAEEVYRGNQWITPKMEASIKRVFDYYDDNLRSSASPVSSPEFTSAEDPGPNDKDTSVPLTYHTRTEEEDKQK